MEIIEDILNIPLKALEFFQKIIDAIISVIQAMNDFYDLLKEFDAKIVEMTASCGSSEFTGLPINEAIGTIRYLVGDLAFYMIYLTVLIGCLFTVYKLVVLIYDAADALILQLTGVNCKSLLSGLLTALKFKW